MNPIDLRRQGVLAIVSEQGAVELRELATEFGCSVDTIRRDVDALERRKLVRRLSGPSVAVTSKPD